MAEANSDGGSRRDDSGERGSDDRGVLRCFVCDWLSSISSIPSLCVGYDLETGALSDVQPQSSYLIAFALNCFLFI